MEKTKISIFKNRDFIYIYFLIFIVGGYLFFWNSKSLFQRNDIVVTPSEVFQEYKYQDRIIKLIRWEYSPKQNVCEVELDITNTAFAGKNEYQIQAFSRTNGKEMKLVTTDIIHDATNAIVHLDNIPLEFAELCIYIVMDQDNKDVAPLKLYATRESVEQVEDLTPKTKMDYQRNRILIQIEEYELVISENAEMIKELQEHINETNMMIEELREKIDFQSEEKQLETISVISQADQNIADAWTEISFYTKENEELENLISELQKKYVESGE